MESADPVNLTRRRLVAGTVVGAAVAGACWLHGHPPMSTGWYPPCYFHALTGLHCPGCGATRAAYALLHGHLGEALHQNALAVVAFPFLGYAIGRALWRWANAIPAPPVAPASPWTVRFALILAPTVIAFGVLRNLPWSPFNLLAPY